MIELNIDFKKLTYKEFYLLLDKICMNIFREEVKSHNCIQLYMKLKWYCDFIQYFIKHNRVMKMNDFEKVLMNNKYFKEDAEMTVKTFKAIQQALLSQYAFIDILDISNFCNKVSSDIKL